MLFFRDVSDLEQLEFTCCMKPGNVVGDPILLLFSGGCAYGRWKLTNYSLGCISLTAKKRDCTLETVKLPRLAGSARRLVECIVEESNYSLKGSSICRSSSRMEEVEAF